MTLKTDEITYNIKSNIAIYKKEGKLLIVKKIFIQKKENTILKIIYFIFKILLL